MSYPICRAITLYSYHMPIRKSCLSAQYSTIGFFDGMSTEIIDVDYAQNDLKSLWWYTAEQTNKCDGTYSFQNIFAMADDEWNEECTDEIFWSEETDRDYPLTMVVFMQFKEYIVDKGGIGEQCRQFNTIVKQHLEGGKGYTYGSVDKNEIIVCLKCRNYHNAVNTIKKLHRIDRSVVYSYSVFSVRHMVLDNLCAENYAYLFDEEIESICLKGITNSIRNSEYTLNLDEKYYDFCERLSERLYANEERKVVIKYGESYIECGNKDRIYDILGDDDFRYIAREVKLGRLLNEYRKEGLLSYLNPDFSFYLFSSGLVLNTVTECGIKIDCRKVQDEGKRLFESMIPRHCDTVTPILGEICKIIENKYFNDDKMLSIYYALYQLLQSFKVLELSPAKRYDFFSMFPPFKVLVQIVYEKLKKEDNENIGERKEIFEFIHKISMTFHSAQRTDLQFFQIQDFNVIVHYAPAKLRAFYAMWILNLSEMYGRFKVNSSKNYSFIFAPGMFGITTVSQLFPSDMKSDRLMLVTLPDRAVYEIKKLLIRLSHEAAHIGCERQRGARHSYALQACARIAKLELHAFMLYEIENNKWMNTDIFIKKVCQDNSLLQELEDDLIEENRVILQQYSEDKRDDECRRERSVLHISDAFEIMLEKYGEKIIADYCSHIKNVYISSTKRTGDRNIYLAQVSRICNDAQIEMCEFIGTFWNIQLKKVADMFYYIEEEAFADLITILTLEHSMEDYIMSFTSDEITEEDIVEANGATAVAVRMALVIDTVVKISKSEWMCANRPSFQKEWTEKQLEKLCISFQRNSVEECLSLQILGYKEAVKDSLKQIDNYQRMYDPVEGGYTITTYGFLVDEEVWNTLSKYLYMCAERYISALPKKNRELDKQQRYFAEVYRHLKQEPFINCMQTIENFLWRYERECDDNLDKTLKIC